MFEHEIDKFAPLFLADTYLEEDQRHLAPFFTNLDQAVYMPLIFSPELVGALCSRTSRAPDDLRKIFLQEFINPFLNPTKDENESDAEWESKINYSKNLRALLEFLNNHPAVELFSNPRARSFYTKWLAQYGDDSIAQMAGSHLVFTGISQVAIKHFEDQRIGLAPIEKSTRYVNYSQKIKGQYMYYIDPVLSELGLGEEYKMAMDNLFGTYTRLIPKMIAWLSEKFPDQKKSVIEKKAFDTLRGLLPASTLSQVAFFGNGQSFEYMVARSLRHHLGEIRWAGERALGELNKVTPSFLRRIEKETSREYQEYLSQKGSRIGGLAKKLLGENAVYGDEVAVDLIEYNPHGEDNIVAGIIFPEIHASWKSVLAHIQKNLSLQERREIISKYLSGRIERWQKVGRAFENTYVRFEIMTNIGAWRDIHRHRMLTQQRQRFTCLHGYDVPSEVTESNLESEFKKAIEGAEKIFYKIERENKDLAQYAATLAHRVRFMQYENLRECFWEIELRTIPEGHPDYRHIEQKKFKLLQKVYPLITEHMRVNLEEYDFARRGQEEKIQKKLENLS